MNNSKNHQKKKRSKHKQKAYKKNKNKNKNKNKKKQSKKEEKITKLSQITQPVEKRIPKCENCHKKQSQFYCPKCEVYYCAKCEEQIHNISALKKHKKHLYNAPYNELVKKANFNICRKHNKELSLYCIDENKLICPECYSICKINNHEIFGLKDYSNEIYEKIKIILNKIQNEENQNEKTIQKSLENQKKIKEKINNICKKIENDSDLLIQKIQDSKINHLNLFKKIEIIINTKIETILKDKQKKQKKIKKNKIKINTIKKFKKDKNHIKLIQGGKEIIKTERKSEKNGKKEKTEEQKKKEKEKKKKKKKKRTERKEKKKKKAKKSKKLEEILEEKEKELEKRKKEKEQKKEEILEECSGEDTSDGDGSGNIISDDSWDSDGSGNIISDDSWDSDGSGNIISDDSGEDEFDPEMNHKNRIKLKNENKTAWNPNSKYYRWGKICGKKIYSSGKHEIKIKIDQFPNPKNQWNQINLGIIKTENRENFIKNHWNREGTYFFQTYWNFEIKKLESRKRKKENGKWTQKNYPKKINLKEDDIFTILLDMDQKKISFKINEKNLEGWENLPEKVNFFALLRGQKGENNQITII
ncbi:zinc finger protein constans-like [Anaeramoeba flamelloides]|uniref:Zinc finger protein constans-like n=1 Tax=Anaeramoeba flamelloides TaxID=1746091 RepID=A0AAV8AAZ8_9EUKA|nr:zinc finger protein constans-like [Anaeramoeba flamelloides]